jgi:branched-chain amino acid transport system permease protein
VAAYAGALLVLAVAPYRLAPVATSTLTLILIYALLAASLDLLVGFTGLPSLGHGAYFGVGAYTAAILARDVTTNGPLLFLAALVAGGTVAALTGAFVVRTRGVYFLMLTLAVGEVIAQVAEAWDGRTGGSSGLSGIPRIEVLPGAGELSITEPLAPIYWYTLAGFVVGYAVLLCVARSPFGRALQGIRDNEPRMRAIGYPTYWYKLGGFCIAGAVAGAAGALLAARETLIAPTDAGLGRSTEALIAVVIGGRGTLWGPCLGAGVVQLIDDTVNPRIGEHGPILLGLVLIAVVYLLPRGLAGLRLPRAWRRR